MLQPELGLLLGSWYRLANAAPAGLIRLAGMMLPGNGWPVRGSFGICGVQPASRLPLKFPALSSAVGTKPLRTEVLVSLFFSYERKKCSLSLMMGPPNVAPQSSHFSAGLGCPACSRK